MGFLVADIHRSLPPGGQFVTYQVRDTIIELATELFHTPRVSLVFWNVPPLRLYPFAKPCRENSMHIRSVPPWTHLRSQHRSRRDRPDEDQTVLGNGAVQDV